MVAIWQEKETGFVIIDYMDETLFDGISMRETVQKRASMAIPDQKVLCRLHKNTRFGDVPVTTTDLELSAKWTKCQATVVKDPDLLEILKPRILRVQQFYVLRLFDDEAVARKWLAGE